MSHLQRKVILAQTDHGQVRRAYWVNPESAQLDKSHSVHVESGVGHKVHTTGSTDPRSRIDISYGLIFSKRANEGVDHALEAIAKVHGVPADLERIPVKVKGDFGAEGRYLVYNPWGGNEIHVNKYAHEPAGAITHEYGHFLDHHLFGNGKPTLGGLGTMKRNPEMKDLMVALNKSKAVTSLREKHKRNTENGDWGHTQASTYLLMQPEIFARAYEQYIATRSGSPHIKESVRNMRESWGRHGYAAQWDDQDFAPIAREFDRVFERRGLLRVRRPR